MLWTMNRHRRILAFTATSVLTIVLHFSSTKHLKFILSATDVANMTQLPNWLISFHFEITKFLFLILDSCFLRLTRGNIAVLSISLSLSRKAVHSAFYGSLGLVKLKSIHFLLSGSCPTPRCLMRSIVEHRYLNYDSLVDGSESH